MHQYIGLLALLLNELEGVLEAVRDLLALAVVQGELELGEVVRVFEAEIHRRTYPQNFTLAELVEVVSEIVPADPYGANASLGRNHLLPVVIFF